MSYTQTLNDALITVAFMIGVTFALTVAMVTSSALWQRHARRAGLGAVEQHLAAAARDADRFGQAFAAGSRLSRRYSLTRAVSMPERYQ